MPVTPKMIGYKPLPYVGAVPAAAVPVLASAATPLIKGALDEIKAQLPKILADIQKEIQSITAPCTQAITGWGKEWDATAGPLLKSAQASTDPLLAYSYAAAIQEMASTAPWVQRFAGQAVVDPPGPLAPRKCGWATAQAVKQKYTIPAAAIMAANQDAAAILAQAGKGGEGAGSLFTQGQLPAWFLPAAAAAALVLIARR